MDATINAPFVSTPSLGLSAFASANNDILKSRIKNALKDAFKSTYLYGAGEDGDEFAEKFADSASGPIASAISGYVKGCIQSQIIMVNPTAAGWMSPIGPVTGAPASTTLKSVTIS